MKDFKRNSIKITIDICNTHVSEVCTIGLALKDNIPYENFLKLLCIVDTIPTSFANQISSDISF